MPSKSPFSLGDQNAGVFAEICEKNGMNACWLQWKFELAVANGNASPFTISTNNDHHCGRLNDGVKRIDFIIDFHNDNPNFINHIRFTEFYEAGESKCYIVTQTSIGHVHEGTECKLWLELPPGTRKEDIGAVIHLWKVQICCDRWQDFLPPNPITQLEKAHRVVAQENVAWLKVQFIKMEGAVTRKDEELAQKSRDVDKLTDEISELHMQLAEVELELEEARSREVSSAAKRQSLAPKVRDQRTPKSAPARTWVRCATSDYDTPPSKRVKLNMREITNDPFVG